MNKIKKQLSILFNDFSRELAILARYRWIQIFFKIYFLFAMLKQNKKVYWQYETSKKESVYLARTVFTRRMLI